MLSLLDPRMWLAAAIAAALLFGGGYFKGSHDRGHTDELERQAAISAANSESRRLEQERQRRVDDVARVAAASENRLRVTAGRARSERDGLLDDLVALHGTSAKSLSASQQSLQLASELLGSCTREYLAVAEAADRADGEARALRASWPN